MIDDYKMETLEGKREDLEIKAAEFIKSNLSKAIGEKGYAVFGVVGGTSVSGILKILSLNELDWEKIHIFNIDEKILSKSSSDRQYNFIKDALNGKGIYHPFSIEEGLDKVNKQLNSLGGRFDIALLSSGGDGHIGSLFPNNSSVRDENEGFILINEAPYDPKQKITASKKLIEKSNSSVLLFFGESKMEASHKFSEDIENTEEWPNRIVNKIDNSLILKSF